MNFRFILWLDECGKNNFSLVGGKNANLGEMRRNGIRTPPGFAITTEAYKVFMESAAIYKEITNTLKHVNPKNIEEVRKAGKYIRGIILSTPIPTEIEQEIVTSYDILCKRCNISDLPVAVRSSATAEDLPESSFAGQQDTFLWIKGKKKVIEAVHKCWASLFSDKAISYRMMAGFPHEKVFISVGILKMVNAKSAGVMFTIDPISGDDSKIVIDANWGIGESIVKGIVVPDHFVVIKDSLFIKETTIGQKEVMIVPVENGVEERKVPEDKRNIPCINTEEVKKIAELGIKTEEYFGSPQDIEWAIDMDLPFPENVFLLQSRPVTAVGEKKVIERKFDKLKKEKSKNDIDHVIDLMIKDVFLQ